MRFSSSVKKCVVICLSVASIVILVKFNTGFSTHTHVMRGDSDQRSLSLFENKPDAKQKPSEAVQDKKKEGLKEAKNSTPELADTKEKVDKVTLSFIYNQLYEFTKVKDSLFLHQVKDEENIPDCPSIPPRMVGAIKTYTDDVLMNELHELNWYVKPGGSYSPQYCKQKESLAIIIPYRNRTSHLSVLLMNLHPLLQKQQRDYTIFVVNQMEGSKFNRAMLMNIGFWEAMKKRRYDCIIFHDVDLIPEDDRNIYNCPNDNPRHMSVAIDKFDYKLTFDLLLGGIVAVRWDIFMSVNGYSNQFFGWGGEDDDFSLRVRNQGYSITRYPIHLARYKMIKHGQDSGNEINEKRFGLLENVKTRKDYDGLNSLTYKLKSIEELPLYTLINAEINQAEVMNASVHSIADFPYSSKIWSPRPTQDSTKKSTSS